MSSKINQICERFKVAPSEKEVSQSIPWYKRGFIYFSQVEGPALIIHLPYDVGASLADLIWLGSLLDTSDISVESTSDEDASYVEINVRNCRLY